MLTYAPTFVNVETADTFECLPFLYWFHFDPYAGTEELSHLEMVAAIVHQLTRNLTDEEVKANPNFAAYFVDHTAGVYPTAASGFPWSAASIQSTGDVIADLSEDMAADAATS